MMQPTNANIEAFGHAPLMRYLIATALDGTTLTYGEATTRLETEVGFSTIFSTRIGYIVGTMIDRILAVDRDAPLLNVLLVSQQDRMPSDGAAGYMANRFEIPKLSEKNARTRYHKLWAECFGAAAAAVYAYSAQDWSELYEKVFGAALPAQKVEKDRGDRKKGTEDDGIRYGRQGEGPNHEALRLWVQANPAILSPDFAGCRSETEVTLDSGDRVDAVYYCEDRIVVLEVKSRDSNDVDLRRGVFQCIKYRAVQMAMDVRQDGYVEPILVTEKAIPGEIRDLLKLHNIAHFQAPMERN